MIRKLTLCRIVTALAWLGGWLTSVGPTALAQTKRQTRDRSRHPSPIPGGEHPHDQRPIKVKSAFGPSAGLVEDTAKLAAFRRIGI
jgi:hypothetical protein